ncbi:MAG: nucleotide exchange factor GrpE [bacterium]
MDDDKKNGNDFDNANEASDDIDDSGENKSLLDIADLDQIAEPSSLSEARESLNYIRNAFRNLKKEFDELNEKYFKILADSENFRKRISREKEESLKYSNENLVKDLLPILDYLDLAINHSASYIDNDTSGNLKIFVDGVKMADNEFIKVLSNHGVKIIETENKNFDPNFHEVVEMVKDSAEPEGKIIEEKRKGYIYKDRLLRPSLICISKPDENCEDNN